MVKKTSNSVKVDFTGVETGGFEVPDGPYVLAVQVVTQKKSQESGNPYLAWEFKVDEGKYKGRKIWDNTSLQPQALWKLRSMLECMGMDIEDGEFELDLSDFEGMKVGAEIANEKYQGKDKPRVVGYMPEEDVDGDTEEEEEEKKPAVKKTETKKVTEPEPEPEEEEEEEEEEDINLGCDRVECSFTIGFGCLASTFRPAAIDASVSAADFCSSVGHCCSLIAETKP